MRGNSHHFHPTVTVKSKLISGGRCISLIVMEKLLIVTENFLAENDNAKNASFE